MSKDSQSSRKVTGDETLASVILIVAVTYILEVVWPILLSRMRHDMCSYAKAHSLG